MCEAMNLDVVQKLRQTIHTISSKDAFFDTRLRMVDPSTDQLLVTTSDFEIVALLRPLSRRYLRLPLAIALQF